MAQAFRSRKQIRNDLNSNQLIMSGTYELDKVVVEWERIVAIDELVKLFLRLSDRTYEKSELRFYVSGYLRDSDENLPDSKIRDYRVSIKSLNQVLKVLEANGAIIKSACEGNPPKWTPKA